MDCDALSHDDAGKEHIQRKELESISQALLQTVSLPVVGKQFCNFILFWVTERETSIPEEQICFLRDKNKTSVKHCCPLKEKKPKTKLPRKRDRKNTILTISLSNNYSNGSCMDGS